MSSNIVMGATQSSTKTSVDIANEFVSNISIGVITKNSTTAAADQSIDVECTDVAFKAMTDACNTDTANRNALIALMIPKNAELAAKMSESEPASCHMCDVTNISMDMNVAISTSAIADNTIANQIKSELTAKLEAATKNSTLGGIGLTDSQVEATTKIKNHIENNFNTSIVNETLNSYSFTQTLKAKNSKLNNINMKLVGTALGSAIVKNALATSADLKGAIDAVVVTDAKTEGTPFPSLFGGLFGTIGIIAAICFIVLVGIIGFGPKILAALKSNKVEPVVVQVAPPVAPPVAPVAPVAPVVSPMSLPVAPPVVAPVAASMSSAFSEFNSHLASLRS